MKLKFSKPIIVAAICVGIAAFWLDLGKGPKLRLESDGAGTLQIANIGKGEVELLSVSVNDRPDCKATLGFNFMGSEFKDPVLLKTGDFRYFSFAGCMIITKARVSTRTGTYTYTFN
jgi:hypothetical protein